MDTETWGEFSHPEYGFSFEHPDEWLVLQNVMGCAAVMVEPIMDLDRFRASIAVAIEEGEHDLKELIETQLGQLTRWYTDHTVVENRPLDIAGLPGCYLHSTYREGIFTIHLEQWPVATPDRVVALAVTTEDGRREELQPVLQRVVQTFTVS